MREPSASRRAAAARAATVPGLTDRPPAVVLVVAAVGAVGLSLLAAGVFGWDRSPGVTRFLAIEPTSRLGGVLLGFVLVVLAKGLAGRRLAAHRVLVGVLAVATLGALAGRHDLRQAGLLLALGVAVVLVHDHFPTRPDSRRVHHVVVGAAAVFVATVAASSTWLVWRNPGLHHGAGAARAAEGSFGAFVGLTGLVQRALPAGSAPASFTLLVGGITAVLALLVVLAPAAAPPPAEAAVRARVAVLAAVVGNDTFAPFVLRHDRAYVFSADGRSAIGYRVLFGVAIAGGDPVGHPEARPAAIDAFLTRCARRGWRPLVLGARADIAQEWAARGMHTVGIGDEVVADVEHFTLDTPKLRNVRQAVKRTKNAGVTSEVLREGSLDERQRAELTAVTAVCWGGLPERGFSMNLDGLLTGIHPDALLVVCRDAAGAVVAFQRYVLCEGGSALSLDTMCRVPSAPNGVNERMIVEAIAWGNARGVRRASLNFAAFRPLFDAEHRSVLEALGYRTIHLLDRWIKLESLYRFNAKFRPTWVPRSVVVRAWSDLPYLLPAALAAEFGGPLDRKRPSLAALVAATAPAPDAEPGPELAEGLLDPPPAGG